MDYIREELQRQRMLLAALLTGQTMAMLPEEMQTTSQTFCEERGDFPAWELRGSAGAATGLPQRGMASLAAGAYLSALGENAPAGEAAALRTVLEALAAGERWALAGRSGEGGLSAAMLPDWVYGSAALEQLAGDGDPAAAIHGRKTGKTVAVYRGAEQPAAYSPGSGSVGRAAAAWTSAAVPESAAGGTVQLVTELRRAEGGGLSDPAALSRAFQRDARRYDGGFRLY